MKARRGIPTVSVVMAAHDAERFIAEAIESILGQTLQDFEFIIVDDGSTDRSQELVKKYMALDTRIHLVSESKKGLARALNIGIGIAKGEFIARMDADDISLPKRLEVQTKTMQSSPDLELLGAEVELIDENGLPFAIRGHVRNHETIRQKLLFGDGGALTHPVTMMRRRTLLNIGGYDESMDTCQDLELFLRVSECGRAENLPNVLLQWRQHSQSVSRLRRHTWALAKRYSIEKTLKRVGVARFLVEAFPEDEIQQKQPSLIEVADRSAYLGYLRTALVYYFRALGRAESRCKGATGLIKAILRYFLGFRGRKPQRERFMCKR